MLSSSVHRLRRKKYRRRQMAEINVVPYIDVMLVLLVIFMVAAPMFNQGVDVDLPQAQAKAINNLRTAPLVLTVDADGDYFLNVGDDQDSPLAHTVLMARAAAVLRQNPAVPVLVKGDHSAGYGAVVRAMALLQAAGAPKVGLMTQMPDASSQ